MILNLRVYCPTHGRSVFEYSLINDLYYCEKRDDADALCVEGVDPEIVHTPMVNGEREPHPVIRDGRVYGGCHWVVTSEMLIDMPDGADPIQWAGWVGSHPELPGPEVGL